MGGYPELHRDFYAMITFKIGSVDDSKVMEGYISGKLYAVISILDETEPEREQYICLSIDELIDFTEMMKAEFHKKQLQNG